MPDVQVFDGRTTTIDILNSEAKWIEVRVPMDALVIIVPRGIVVMVPKHGEQTCYTREDGEGHYEFLRDDWDCVEVIAAPEDEAFDREFKAFFKAARETMGGLDTERVAKHFWDARGKGER